VCSGRNLPQVAWRGGGAGAQDVGRRREARPSAQHGSALPPNGRSATPAGIPSGGKAGTDETFDSVRSRRRVPGFAEALSYSFGTGAHGHRFAYR